MKTDKYPEGYIPKIAYWKGRLHEAHLDMENATTASEYDAATKAATRASSKIEYFTSRQLEVYG